MSHFLSHCLVALYFFTCPCFAISAIQNWQKTTAKIVIIKNDSSILNLTGDTVLGPLIKNTNKPLNNLLEEDNKTLLSFSIQYVAPIKLKGEVQFKERLITQYGLYRELPHRTQNYIQKNQDIDIRFSSDDPTSVQLIIDGHFVDIPGLVTGTIADKQQ